MDLHFLSHMEPLRSGVSAVAGAVALAPRRPLARTGLGILAMLPLSLLAQPAASTAVPIAGNPWGLLMGLLFLLVLVVGAWWLVRRMGGLSVAGSRQMRVLASLPVGARERVVLVEIAGEQWALGVAPGRVSLLHRFDEPVWREPGSGDDFSQRMRQVLQQGLGR